MGLGQEVLRKDKRALLAKIRLLSHVMVWLSCVQMTVGFLVTDLLFVFISDQIIKYTVEHLV